LPILVTGLDGRFAVFQEGLDGVFAERHGECHQAILLGFAFRRAGEVPEFRCGIPAIATLLSQLGSGADDGLFRVRLGSEQRRRCREGDQAKYSYAFHE
jgi:hypothetical protein